MIDLHGRLDLVRCMECERRSAREELQGRLEKANARLASAVIHSLSIRARAGANDKTAQSLQLSGAAIQEWTISSSKLSGSGPFFSTRS